MPMTMMMILLPSEFIEKKGARVRHELCLKQVFRMFLTVTAVIMKRKVIFSPQLNNWDCHIGSSFVHQFYNNVIDLNIIVAKMQLWW